MATTAALNSKSGGDEHSTSTADQPLRCVKCDQTLSQQRYILHDALPYCIHCYETNYSNVCHGCNTVIATDSKVPDSTLYLYFCRVQIPSACTYKANTRTRTCYAPPLGQGALTDDARLTSVCLSRISGL